jgi:hypothetical protein
VLQVRLLNVSSSGLAVESRESLRIGERYEFHLVGARGRSRPLFGIVLWCRLQRTEKGVGDDIHPVYQAGIQRVGGPSED